MKWFLVALVVAISRFATASEEPSTTSESALLAYASASYETVEKQRVELGRLNGAAVVADFICSDVCPDYTVRVIHYELQNAQTCRAVGGVEKAIRIPVGIGATDKVFCFPKVLVDNWKNYQRKMSSVPAGVGPHE